MAILPKHILRDLTNGNTSLGDHPAFPPEDEEKFVIKLLSSKYLDVTDGLPIDNIGAMKNELGQLLTMCVKREETIKEALEQLCVKVVTDMFNIPEDTIIIEANLVSHVDSSKQRMVPEKTDDFEFDSLADMRNLSDEVYKRRLVDALVSGAALYYSNDIKMYLADLFTIDPEIASLYSKIIKYNTALMYADEDNTNDDSIEGGSVAVYVGDNQSKVRIKAEAIIFPALLSELIKGILELATLQGLPEDKKKAKYVMKKADFKYAELWDMRLGLPLWETIINQVESDIEPNFLLMELSMLDCDTFNETLGEIFCKTRVGKERLNEIVRNILRNQESDDFNQFVDMKNAEFQINDDYFDADDLITDDYFKEDELLIDNEL